MARFNPKSLNSLRKITYSGADRKLYMCGDGRIMSSRVSGMLSSWAQRWRVKNEARPISRYDAINLYTSHILGGRASANIVPMGGPALTLSDWQDLKSRIDTMVAENQHIGQEEIQRRLDGRPPNERPSVEPTRDERPSEDEGISDDEGLSDDGSLLEESLEVDGGGEYLSDGSLLDEPPPNGSLLDEPPPNGSLLDEPPPNGRPSEEPPTQWKAFGTAQ